MPGHDQHNRQHNRHTQLYLTRTRTWLGTRCMHWALCLLLSCRAVGHPPCQRTGQTRCTKSSRSTAPSAPPSAPPFLCPTNPRLQQPQEEEDLVRNLCCMPDLSFRFVTCIAVARSIYCPGNPRVRVLSSRRRRGEIEVLNHQMFFQTLLHTSAKPHSQPCKGEAAAASVTPVSDHLQCAVHRSLAK